MKTLNVTLVTMLEATDTASVTAFVQPLVERSGWELVALERRSMRVEPPEDYWAVYAIRAARGAEERDLRLVARGAFVPQSWEKLQEALTRHGSGRPCDPLDGVGYPTLFPETQHAFWFYPFDLAMPSLATVADPDRAAPILRQHLNWPGKGGGRLAVERLRYVPEISALLRYRLDDAQPVYGKVQPGDRGARTHKTMRRVAALAAASDGRLKTIAPLAYVPELGLLLQKAADGEPIPSDRTRPEFADTANAAAEALSVIHESNLRPLAKITVDAEIARLEEAAKQFAFVHPRGYFLFSDLVTHIASAVRGCHEEDWVPTHGDMKYDQFVCRDGQYTLLDFDDFAWSETSYDLGKFCAYAIPSRPLNWEDSSAAEVIRQRFLSRYRELRPEATLDRFQIYEAINLGVRAMTLMWMRNSGWELAADAFLVLAMERLKTRLPA